LKLDSLLKIFPCSIISLLARLLGVLAVVRFVRPSRCLNLELKLKFYEKVELIRRFFRLTLKFHLRLSM